MNKTIKSIHEHSNIDNLIPGVKGQRAFPSSEFRAADPFVMLDHIGSQKVGKDYFLDGTGHDHPHRGFETLTFMFEGQLQHRDSLGNKVSLTSGSVQRMNAGSGVIHGGDMSSDPQTENFHEIQLWVNNPASEKMSAPDIYNLTNKEIPQKTLDNIQLRVVSGQLNGLSGKIKTKANTQIAHLIAHGTGSIQIGSLSGDKNVMVYVMEGNVKIDGKLLHEFQLAVLSEEGDKVEIITENPAQLLILSGTPLNEPIAFGGPFVMNSQEEISQAYKDYEKGLFGKIV